MEYSKSMIYGIAQNTFFSHLAFKVIFEVEETFVKISFCTPEAGRLFNSDLLKSNWSDFSLQRTLIIDYIN